MSERFQVLALDGGGVKALFTAGVLAHLEDDHGVTVSDCFDLIVGTSAGGIIALGLGAGLAPREILGHFQGLASRVFPRWRRYSPHRLVLPTYSARPLRTVLEEIFQARLMRDSTKRLLVPAYNVGKGEVHVFKTPHHYRFKRDGSVPMVDVALATASAPTYFPAHRMGGVRLVDGGVWVNNPSTVGIAEAVSVLGVALNDVRVLSIGTTDEVRKHPQSLDGGGAIQWALKATKVVLTATTRGTVGTSLHLLDEDRYERFNVEVPGGMYALDRVDIDDLGGVAYSVSRTLGSKFATKFADHVAAPYAPHSVARANQKEAP